MVVDTATFRAIQARAETADLLQAEVRTLMARVREISVVHAMAEYYIELGRVMERQQYAGRHARPRRDWHGLRLVQGGGAR